jgi:hypothetical protein
MCNNKNMIFKAWTKSVDYLKNHLHPKSNRVEMNESIYKQLATNPQQIFEIIRNLIMKWREENPTVENS